MIKLKSGEWNKDLAPFQARYSEEQNLCWENLVARSDKIFESDVVTPYMQNPSSEFIEYDASGDFYLVNKYR